MTRDEKEHQEQHKVVDRRRFTAQGELRPDAEDPEPSAVKPLVAADSPRDASPQAEAKKASSPPPPPPEFSDQAHNAYAQAGEGETQARFESLLMSLSTTAMFQLGLVEDPEQGRLPTDLAAARHTIDLLGMLEEKTRGNLSAQEQKILEQLLAELRMLFVQVSSGQMPAASPDK